MVGFEAALAKMDADVDIHIGETIWYTVEGLPPVEHLGFVSLPESYAPANFDEPARIWMLKIAKSRVPAPKKTDTMTCSRLPGIWKFGVIQTDEDPTYWRIKLEAVN